MKCSTCGDATIWKWSANIHIQIDFNFIWGLVLGLNNVVLNNKYQANNILHQVFISDEIQKFLLRYFWNLLHIFEWIGYDCFSNKKKNLKLQCYLKEQFSGKSNLYSFLLHIKCSWFAKTCLLSDISFFNFALGLDYNGRYLSPKRFSKNTCPDFIYLLLTALVSLENFCNNLFCN